MELWRKSAEPVPHDANQPSEARSWGTALLGGGAALHVWFTRMNREPVGPDCRWSFPELPDGDYVARLVRPEGSGGSEEVKVNAGSAQTIAIPAPTITLSGLVTLDGVPHAAQIRFRDQSWRGPVVTATAGADGHYTAVLDRPSAYVITVRASARGAAGRVAELHEGVNQLDIPATTATGATTDLPLTS